MITPEQIDRALDLFERLVAAIEYDVSPEAIEDDQAEAEFAFIPDGPLDS